MFWFFCPDRKSALIGHGIHLIIATARGLVLLYVIGLKNCKNSGQAFYCSEQTLWLDVSWPINVGSVRVHCVGLWVLSKIKNYILVILSIILFQFFYNYIQFFGVLLIAQLPRHPSALFLFTRGVIYSLLNSGGHLLNMGYKYNSQPAK